jgi:hypothetical protein
MSRVRARQAYLLNRPSPSLGLVVLLAVLTACTNPPPAPRNVVNNPNFDPETQALIANAQRVVFVVPFSHWDTDWHDTFDHYVKLSDQNILAAIRQAQQDPRFRYAIEQVLFAQHFWDNYPQYRADLKAAIQQRQITFAWAGVTQPETSLVAPAIQERNFQLGRQWIADTFGVAYVPPTAWQSDAFGTSAAFPLFLSKYDIPYLFIGRGPRRCDPSTPDCVLLPHAFYWKSPATPEQRILVAYLPYPTAWDAIHKLPDETAQLDALRRVVDDQFSRVSGKYILLPMGSDFIDPLPNLSALVAKWNATDPSTVLVMADPETAFRYLATQDLPEFSTDLNPLWQGFYASRPYAKIADKESAFYLTAADQFGSLIGAPASAAWYTATINAHYDNVGAVSFDRVWDSTQRPRFEQTANSAASDLASRLAIIATHRTAPLVVFNPSSRARSGVVEIDQRALAADQHSVFAQPIDSTTSAIWIDAAPPLSDTVPVASLPILIHPAAAFQTAGAVTLANGLVTVTLDADHGGAFAELQAGAANLLTAPGDDVVYVDDSGDIYGARFGAESGRESDTSAQVSLVATGPLVARAQAVFVIGDQPVTKTVTLHADDPLIEVTLNIKALPETTALVQLPTMISTTLRTDDLGFAAFQHPIDSRPIISGDITYRRAIFYPIISWSTVNADGIGLSLITHGLQGVAGTDTLSLMLVRQVTDPDGEGVTDTAYHTLRYAYLPQMGSIAAVTQLAAEFNEPLIAVWKSKGSTLVQIPFCGVLTVDQLSTDVHGRCND